jgi:hypothetical protein
MPATLSEVRSQAYSLINASTTYSTLNSDLFNASETDEAALERDLRVARAVLKSKDSEHHKLFAPSTASAVATGTELLDHVGDIFNVKRTRTDASVVQARRVAYAKLLTYKDDDAGVHTVANIREKYYALTDNTIVFAGGGSLSYQYRTLSKTAALQSPVDFQHLIVVGVLADLYGKEALSETLAQFYNRQFDAGIVAIERGGSPAPLEVAQ